MSDPMDGSIPVGGEQEPQALPASPKINQRAANWPQRNAQDIEALVGAIAPEYGVKRSMVGVPNGHDLWVWSPSGKKVLLRCWLGATRRWFDESEELRLWLLEAKAHRRAKFDSQLKIAR